MSSADCAYNITTVTGTSTGANTGSHVLLRLHEGNQTTPWILLKNTDGKRFRLGSKDTFSFDAACFAHPCVTLMMTAPFDPWFARSLKIEVPDERNKIIINDFQFDIVHWITNNAFSACECDKTAYVAFGRRV
ncbi:hypothetical protein LSAT2_009612 [Lamellibrachia satsuma]|nr:hypothetical protein LSAT2_009612 [Lamellibrachia satsuma]